MSPEPADLKARVARVLGEQIVPALHMDGTQFEVVDVSAGVAQIRLHGLCGGCPGSVMGILMGIEQELRRHIPEVQYLEALP
jgi:Fe-S cluster biogenesis protein NfuA